MSQFRKRTTQEFDLGAPSPVRLLGPMLVGVALATGAYWALGLRTRTAEALPEVVLRVDDDVLHLPDGSTCPLPNSGCATQLQSLPMSEIRIVTHASTSFAQTTPILRMVADRHEPALLDDGNGPVEVVPKRPSELKTWSTLDIDAPGMRLRVIQRSDGFWLAGAAGKILGFDTRGPTLPPLASGPDLEGLTKKLALVRAQFADVEDTCAVLPSLDTSVTDVVHTAVAAHSGFRTVLVAVP
jgi:hypothetical protein